MVGMAVADSLGHNFEFEHVQNEPYSPIAPQILYPFEGIPSGKVLNKPYSGEAVGQFQLRPGQWTDDTSMGLCLADSLLTCKSFDGSNARIWFWNWLMVITILVLW